MGLFRISTYSAELGPQVNSGVNGLRKLFPRFPDGESQFVRESDVVPNTIGYLLDGPRETSLNA